jgi:PadR family transcriptional regulator, regulatory protein PadR
MATSSNESELPQAMTLSGKEALVLQILIVSSDSTGLDLARTSGGLLKRGTIYVTLHRMEAKGLVESRQEPRVEPEIGIPRRLYKCTGLGERSFAEHQRMHYQLTRSLVTVGG